MDYKTHPHFPPKFGVGVYLIVRKIQYISASQERERRAAVTERLSGLVGEAEQEGGGRKREPGPARETERDTLEHRSRGPDRQIAQPRP